MDSKFFIILVIVTLAWLPPLEATATEMDFKSEWNTLKDAHTNSCGGLLTSSSGEIKYEQHHPHERCVWFIRTPNVSEYYFLVTQLGFTPSVEVQLTLTGFGHGRKEKIKHEIPKSTGMYEIKDAVVAMVTFHTDPMPITNGTAKFSLYFVARHNMNYKTAHVRSVHVTGDLDHGHIQKNTLASGEKYFDFELSTFYFPPSKITTNDPNCVTEVGFVVSGLETDEDCLDVVRVFSFNKNSIWYSKWEDAARLCNATTRAWSSSEPLLAGFWSDQDTVNTGFEIFYAKKCTE